MAHHTGKVSLSSVVVDPSFAGCCESHFSSLFILFYFLPKSLYVEIQ